MKTEEPHHKKMSSMSFLSLVLIVSGKRVTWQQHFLLSAFHLDGVELDPWPYTWTKDAFFKGYCWLMLPSDEPRERIRFPLLHVPSYFKKEKYSGTSGHGIPPCKACGGAHLSPTFARSPKWGPLMVADPEKWTEMEGRFLFIYFLI